MLGVSVHRFFQGLKLSHHSAWLWTHLQSCSIKVQAPQSFGKDFATWYQSSQIRKHSTQLQRVSQQAANPIQNPRPNIFPNPATEITKNLCFLGFGRWTPPKIYPNGFFPPNSCGKTSPPQPLPPVDRPRVRVRCQVNPPRLRWSTGARWPQRGPVARGIGGFSE